MKPIQFHHNLFFAALTFILLIQNSGCNSYRIISSYDLPSPEKYHYTIYGNSLQYPLENTIISNDSISGTVNMTRSYKMNSIHIYPVSDSVIKFYSANTLGVAMSSIAKVEKSGNAEANNHPFEKPKKPKAPVGVVIFGILTTMVALIVRSAWFSLNSD
jgi:hypothetical protein